MLKRTPHLPNNEPVNPKVDVVDTGTHIEVEAAVPGLSKDDVNVEYTDGILTISGEKINKVEDNKNYIHRELKRSSFRRSFNVDSSLLDVDKINAEFKDGILKIGLENVIPDHKKPRKIAIGNEIKFAKAELLTESAV